MINIVLKSSSNKSNNAFLNISKALLENKKNTQKEMLEEYENNPVIKRIIKNLKEK